MRKCVMAGAVAMLALAISSASGDDPVKSGLEVGKTVSAFHPQNITGPFAGQKQCLV